MSEAAFEYSGFPGSYATPLFGAAGLLLVGVGGYEHFAASRFWPAIVLVAGSIVLALAGRWLAREGVLRAPLLAARGTNLVATRGAEAPRVWLCAHLDSKSQPIPTLVRSTAIVIEGIGVAVAIVLAGLAAAGLFTPPILWVLAGLVTLMGAIPVMLSVVTFNSPGALDNASGVATVVAAAAMLADRGDLGVLITDAEELGLAGARAWAAQSRSATTTTVLNCDGVDDQGRIAVMHTGRAPAELLAAVAHASLACGVSHEAMRMLPGVLTDSVAFADAGLASVTFSRGTWRSLARVHSRHDDLSHLRGTGIADTATLMAATVRALGERN